MLKTKGLFWRKAVRILCWLHEKNQNKQNLGSEEEPPPSFDVLVINILMEGGCASGVAAPKGGNILKRER